MGQIERCTLIVEGVGLMQVKHLTKIVIMIISFNA